jgi:hypothetical protein
MKGSVNMSSSSPPKKLTSNKSQELGALSGLGTSGGALNYKNMADHISKE